MRYEAWLKYGAVYAAGSPKAKLKYDRQRKTVMPKGSFIDGEWFLPSSRRITRNVNPADLSDVIAEFPAATIEDTERAICCARKALPAWSRTPAPARGRIVRKAYEIARERAEDIAAAITREEGKLLREAMGEVLKGLHVLEFYAGCGFHLTGRTIPSELAGVFAFTQRFPVGVAGIITPWNFPWSIPCWKIAPALVAGNTIVFKPATPTPATASMLVEIFQEAGLPGGVLNMLVGPGSQVGETIIGDPSVRVISFTGSNDVGIGLNVKAAARGAKVTCEMGGKNAVIVMPDADIEKAAAAIYDGAFGSAGQRCTATSRAILVGGEADTIIEILKSKAEKTKIGPGIDPESEMGPLVDEEQRRSVLSYVEIGKDEGARLVAGGRIPQGWDEGCYFQPTIFDHVTPNMRIFREEIFGPVLCVSRVKDFNEALDLANAVDYGLTGAIFTRDIDAAMRFIERLECGMAHVNEPTIGGEAQLPFGGTKATGIGNREMALEGLDFFTELKTVFINYSGIAGRSMIR